MLTLLQSSCSEHCSHAVPSAERRKPASHAKVLHLRARQSTHQPHRRIRPPSELLVETIGSQDTRCKRTQHHPPHRLRRDTSRTTHPRISTCLADTLQNVKGAPSADRSSHIRSRLPKAEELALTLSRRRSTSATQRSIAGTLPRCGRTNGLVQSAPAMRTFPLLE